MEDSDRRLRPKSHDGKGERGEKAGEGVGTPLEERGVEVDACRGRNDIGHTRCWCM